MLQLSRNGLRLQSLTSLDESQGSSNVKVSIQNDGTYTNYSTQLHYGYYVHGFSYTKGIARYENGVFILPREAFEQYGLLNLSVLLVSSDEELMTNQVQFIVKAAPRGDMVIDDIPSAQQQVLQLVQTTLDQYAHTINLNKNEIAVLKSRMDSFTSLQQGSTTGDAELIDGRVGYDGKTYENIGGAIRGQVSQLSDEIDGVVVSTKTINMFDKRMTTKGYYVDYASGALRQNSLYYASDFIRIDPSKIYKVINSSNQQLALFDENKKYITGYSKESEWLKAMQDGNIDSRVAYVRLTIHDRRIDTTTMYEYNGKDYYVSAPYGGEVNEYNLSNEIKKNYYDNLIYSARKKFIIESILNEGVCSEDSMIFESDINKVTFKKDFLNFGNYIRANFDLVNDYKNLKIGDKVKIKTKFFSNVADIENYVLIGVNQFNTGNYINNKNINIIDYDEESQLYEYELLVDFKLKINYGLMLYFQININDQLPNDIIIIIDNCYLMSDSFIDYIIDKIDKDKEEINDTTILEVGTGKQFTKLSEALKAIVDPSMENKYVVYFYGNGEEYDLYDETIAWNEEQPESKKIGLLVPEYTTIVGVGGKDKCILALRLPEEEKSMSISPLNIKGSSCLKGLTIISKNTRYTVHDDYYDNLNSTRLIEECTFISEGNTLHRVWGSGYRSGFDWRFRNCIFKTDVLDEYCASFHNNVYFATPARITFENCRFINNQQTTRKNVTLQTLFDNANNIINDIYFYGCKISSLEIKEENVSLYGSGILTKVSGYGNDIKTDDVTMSNTDGKDYSSYVDLI